ncbi:endonuclease/exonuclease/phosphatase family protein [Alkalihalophilus lindianensis]|uniref:Endonuclease/exonuclease/phosphatase family protein n=1 Tax=Alkalihalophilus lindianensis TaxID=1630542 RepID=A0ABU3X9Q3_9BACI|nr:endonuclease/exonuclease/phosphatase family protein [Alkalihalophilus lindianensis]MDV2684622.1 endonuclease/exonuclease/phosphatase family protein [Alkalihalophilus lindianensis]
MKLLTLNVHAWQEDQQDAKINELAQAIYEEQYDVIAIQEVSQHRDAELIDGDVKADNYGYVLLEKLTSLGGDHYKMVWAPSHYGYEVYEEGLALLTRHPIVDFSHFYVTKSKEMTNWKARTIVHAKIDVNGFISNFYSCHLGWWEDTEEPAREQMEKLLNHLPSNERVYLMGDFNNHADLRGEGYDFLSQNGFLDTYQLAQEKDSGVTVEGKIAGWDQNKQDLRIDLILTNQPTVVSTSNVVFNGKNRSIVSDHYGVEVTVSPKSE